MRLLFDLNAEVRDGYEIGKTLKSTWNSLEAEKLFKYCVEKGYGDNIDWELGNGLYLYIQIICFALAFYLKL